MLENIDTNSSQLVLPYGVTFDGDTNYIQNMKNKVKIRQVSKDTVET